MDGVREMMAGHPDDVMKRAMSQGTGAAMYNTDGSPTHLSQLMNGSYMTANSGMAMPAFVQVPTWPHLALLKQCSVFYSH